jgi:hypothetical protein
MLRVTRLLAATALAAGATVGFANMASAGEQLAAPLTIAKTVSGPVPAGTTFTATINCDDDIIVDTGGSTDTVTVTFDASGQPTSPDTFGFNDPGACTVTETANGGASSTTYSCEGNLGVEAPIKEGDFSATQVEEDVCPTAGPQAAPISVNIISEGQDATVTIHNTFVAPTPQPGPQPAAQVVAQPVFTG